MRETHVQPPRGPYPCFLHDHPLSPSFLICVLDSKFPPQKNQAPEGAPWCGREHPTTGGTQAGVKNFLGCKERVQGEPRRLPCPPAAAWPLLQPSLCPDPHLGSVHPSSPRSCWFHHISGLSRSRKLGLHSGPQGSWGDSGAHLLQRTDEEGGSPHLVTAVSGLSEVDCSGHLGQFQTQGHHASLPGRA